MSKAIVKASPVELVKEPAPMKEFDTARQHVKKILEHGRRTAHESILLGHELNRLKKALDVRAGRPSKKLPQTAEIKSWGAMVEEQTGFSLDTCDRCMKLAEGAKKHIPMLMSDDVLEKPFYELPEARQGEVFKALEKAADGRSMAQMMFDFGVWKEKKVKSPPRPTKQSAAARNDQLDPAALRDLALENGNTLRDIRDGKAHEYLHDDELNALFTLLEGWTREVGVLIQERAASEGKAGKKGGKGK